MLDVYFVFSACTAAISSNHVSALIAGIFKYGSKVDENCQSITAIRQRKKSKFLIESLICCYCHVPSSFTCYYKKIYAKFTSP